MTTVIDTQLAERLREKIKEVDERAKETMAAGMLANFGEYRFSGGYRKGLADAVQLLDETLDEIMKE